MALGILILLAISILPVYLVGLYIYINQICLETHERFFRFGIIKLLRMNRILHRNGYLLVSIENDDYTYIRKMIKRNRQNYCVNYLDLEF